VLIAIAGADGAGKTTLSRTLHQALLNAGMDAVRLDRFDILNSRLSPPSAFITTDVKTLRESTLLMPASARLLFMLWSMALTVSQQLDGANPEKIVIYDSYWMKHTAAEIIFGVDETAAMAIVALLPPPDLTIYVKLKPEELLARKVGDMVPYECGLDYACRPDSFLRHQIRILGYLDRWSRRFGWQEVDGSPPTDVLAASLVRRIQENRKDAAMAHARRSAREAT